MTTRQDPAWLDAHWMPFNGNRQFKQNPRMFVGAEGAYYIDDKGKKVFDGLSGLWCCGLGHGRKEIADAIAKTAATCDYTPAFQFGHPHSFALANKIKELTPAGLDYVFFTGSGSESADTSLKMARAYWRAKASSSTHGSDNARLWAEARRQTCFANPRPRVSTGMGRGWQSPRSANPHPRFAWMWAGARTTMIGASHKLTARQRMAVSRDSRTFSQRFAHFTARVPHRRGAEAREQ